MPVLISAFLGLSIISASLLVVFRFFLFQIVVMRWRRWLMTFPAASREVCSYYSVCQRRHVNTKFKSALIRDSSHLGNWNCLHDYMKLKQNIFETVFKLFCFTFILLCGKFNSQNFVVQMLCIGHCSNVLKHSISTNPPAVHILLPYFIVHGITAFYIC